MGLYNMHQISKLKEALAEQQAKTNMLIQVTNEHSQILKELASDLKLLTSVVDAFLVHNPAKISAVLGEQVGQLEWRVRQTRNALQQLQHKRLAIDFLSSYQLTQMHESLLELAKQNNVQLLPKFTSDYFQLETSYLQDGPNILVLLHVPCINPVNILTVYRYLAYPYPLPAKLQYSQATIAHTLYDILQDHAPSTVNMTMVNDSPYMEALFIEPEAQFIAVGREKQYKIVSDGELAMCSKRSSMFLCEEHQVLRHDLEQSCLGSLFIRNEEGAKRFCKIRKEILRETVYQLSATEHLVFSPQPFTATVQCRNNSYYPMFLSQNDLVTIPSGCRTRLQSHSIASDLSIDISSPAIRFPWHWNPLDLPASMLNDPDKTDIQMQRLHNSIKLLENVTAHPTIIPQISADHLINPLSFHWSWWTICIILICVIIALFILYCMFCRRGSRSNQPAYNLMPAPSNRSTANDARPLDRCQHGQLRGLCC